MNRKNQAIKKKKQSNKRNQLALLFSLFIFLFGAVSCGPDTREGAEDVAEEVNTELETTEWKAREGQREWGDKNFENVNRTPEEQFTELDRDADQRLSYTEFEERMGENNYYREWDTDQDRTFSEAELREALFNNWDRDNDGSLDKSEYQALNTAWRDQFGEDFNTWDKNQDSRLDKDEFHTAMADAGVPYDAWDTDKDKNFSEEELRRATFESRDVDRDEYVSQEEYQDLEYNIWGLGEL